MHDLAAIRKRYEAATDGDWGHSADFGHRLDIKAWMLIAVSGNSFLSLGRIIRQEDLDFIAHAREDLPAVVEALEETRVLLKEIVNAKPVRLQAAMFAALQYLGERR